MESAAGSPALEERRLRLLRERFVVVAGGRLLREGDVGRTDLILPWDLILDGIFDMRAVFQGNVAWALLISRACWGPEGGRVEIWRNQNA